MSAQIILLWGLTCLAADDSPTYEGRAIFPPEKLHNHSSCIVELPNGDFLACWYRGSGERKADDVQVMGSRLRKGSQNWSKPFVLADTPGFPDTNPCLFVDPRKKLWLLWPVILANEWHTALMTYRISSRYEDPDAPIAWDEEKNLLFKPGAEFGEAVDKAIADTKLEGAPRLADGVEAWFTRVKSMSADKLSTRLGWMTRVHPIGIDGSRMLVPLYSDGFDFSIVAITDDWGAHWEASAPLVGGGNVQPSIVVKKDGTLAAYMRDNGLPPKRLLYSESKDRGKTWSRVVDTDIPNPGSGVEAIVLKEGLWALVNNDTERGRHSLAIWLSADEGKTWPWKRHLEPRSDFSGEKSASYPSIVQASDGAIHVTYSRSTVGETIWHARVSVEWIKAGE